MQRLTPYVAEKRMRAIMRVSKTKSSHRASAIQSITCGFVFCLAMTLTSQVSATGDREAWRISTAAGLVRYTTHGTKVHGHSFGFIKKPGFCEFDNLYLSWSSYEPGVQQIKGTVVTLEMNVDGAILKIDIRLISARKYPLLISTIITFGNFIIDQDFVDLLKKGKEIRVRIAGPEKAVKLFDIPSDTFTLDGYRAARRQAKKTCEKMPIAKLLRANGDMRCTQFLSGIWF